VVLHADELGPAVLLSGELPKMLEYKVNVCLTRSSESGYLQLRKLHSPHRTRTNIPYLPTPNQIMQRLHRLLKRSIRIETVDLQQINVLQVKTLERSIDSVEDSLARQTTLVDIVFQLGQLAAILYGT
jgi:hypothetical protein